MVNLQIIEPLELTLFFWTSSSSLSMQTYLWPSNILQIFLYFPPSGFISLQGVSILFWSKGCNWPWLIWLGSDDKSSFKVDLVVSEKYYFVLLLIVEAEEFNTHWSRLHISFLYTEGYSSLMVSWGNILRLGDCCLICSFTPPIMSLCFIADQIMNKIRKLTIPAHCTRLVVLFRRNLIGHYF